MDRAMEQSTFAFNKKRGINTEMRMIKDQRDDIGRYEDLTRQKIQIIQEAMLCRLANVEGDAQSVAQQLEEKQAQLGNLPAISEEALKDAKKRQAKRHKDLLNAERRVRKAQLDLEKHAPRLLELTEKVQFEREKLAKLLCSKESCQSDLQKQADLVNAAQSELSDLQATLEQFEQTAQEQLQSISKLSPKILAEYDELKSQVIGQVGKEQMRREAILTKQAPHQLAQRQASDKLDELGIRRDQLSLENSALNDRRAQMEAALEKVLLELEAKRVEANAQAARRLKLGQAEEELTERLRTIMERLLQAKSAKQEGEREIRQRAMIESLKRIFPGVHGRLVELVRPSQPRYELALSTVLGRNLDGIVVSDERTALECIKYLKEQRLGTATFLPLDTLVVKALDEGLRTAMPGSRPAIDVVQVEGRFSRAVQYACGNALICDDMQVARRLCFGDRAWRVKAVTLDGAVIHKSGLMSGGGQIERRWEEAEVAALKTERDQCLASLADISKSLKRDSAEEKLTIEMQELQGRQRFLQDELSALNRKIEGITTELAHIQTESDLAREQSERAQREISRSSRELESIDGAVEAVEKVVFAEFCQRLVFPNIREFENVRLSRSREYSERKLQFTMLIAKFENQ